MSGPEHRSVSPKRDAEIHRLLRDLIPKLIVVERSPKCFTSQVLTDRLRQFNRLRDLWIGKHRKSLGAPDSRFIWAMAGSRLILWAPASRFILWAAGSRLI